MENCRALYESKINLMVDIRRLVDKTMMMNEINLSDSRFIVENTAEKETKNIVREMLKRQNDTRYSISMLSDMINIVGKML